MIGVMEREEVDFGASGVIMREDRRQFVDYTVDYFEFKWAGPNAEKFWLSLQYLMFQFCARWTEIPQPKFELCIAGLALSSNNRRYRAFLTFIFCHFHVTFGLLVELYLLWCYFFWSSNFHAAMERSFHHLARFLIWWLSYLDPSASKVRLNRRKFNEGRKIQNFEINMAHQCTWPFWC